jgi:hypothetical protein
LAQAFTVIKIESAPQGRVYTILCVPAPATEGLNTPVTVFVMPVPDHTPPSVAAVKVIGEAMSQIGPAGQMVASQQTKVN